MRNLQQAALLLLMSQSLDQWLTLSVVMAGEMLYVVTGIAEWNLTMVETHGMMSLIQDLCQVHQ